MCVEIDEKIKFLGIQSEARGEPRVSRPLIDVAFQREPATAIRSLQTKSAIGAYCGY